MDEEEEDPPKFVAHILIPQVTVLVTLRKLDNALMADGAEAMANKEVMMELLVILEVEMEAGVIIMDKDVCCHMLMEMLVITEDVEAIAINLDIKMFLYKKVFLMDVVLEETIMANIMESKKHTWFQMENCTLLTMAMRQLNKVTDSMTMTWGLLLMNGNIKMICILRAKQIQGLMMVMMNMRGHKTNLFKMMVMKVSKKMSPFLLSGFDLRDNKGYQRNKKETRRGKF